MRIGRFIIEQLSEGIFEVYKDGSFHKVDSSNITSKPPLSGLRKYSTNIGIDPILIRSGVHNILIDTGLGWGLDNRSNYEDTSNLKTNLDIFGLTPSDITHVILSHLHFDHAAGSSFVDSTSSTQATMPYAKYYVQKREWEYALSQIDESTKVLGAGYNLDELFKLKAEGFFELIDSDYLEIIPGIEIIWTGGHTPGHQIVKIKDGINVAYYLGDLVPTEHHINHYSMKQMDVDPIQAKKAKTLILREAYEEGAALLFYHSIHVKAGVLEKDVDRKFVLKEIEIK